MKKRNLQFLSSYSTSMVVKTNLAHKNIRLKNISSSMKNLKRLLLMPLMVLVVLFVNETAVARQRVSGILATRKMWVV